MLPLINFPISPEEIILRHLLTNGEYHCVHNLHKQLNQASLYTTLEFFLASFVEVANGFSKRKNFWVYFFMTSSTTLG